MAGSLTVAPRLSIVMPVGATWSPYLQRNLLALQHQSARLDSYEAIVAIDGDGALTNTKHMLASLGLSYPVTVIESSRPYGRSMAHRNHARNAGCRIARGDILWVLDCDHLPSPNAVQRIITEYDNCITMGLVPVFLFPTFTLSMGTEKYILQTEKLNAKDATTFWHVISNMPITASEFSGFAEKYEMEAVGTKPVKTFQENTPAFPRALWRALGGFDERFIGWGGNKHEFSRRLSRLNELGIISARVIPQIRLEHQPHKKDPSRSARNEQTRKNRALFAQKERDMRNSVQWWLEQVERVKLVRSEILKVDAFDTPLSVVIVADTAEEIKRLSALSISETATISIVTSNPRLKSSVDIAIAPSGATGIDKLNIAMAIANTDRIAILGPRSPGLKDSALLTHSGQAMCALDPHTILCRRDAVQRFGGIPTTLANTWVNASELVNKKLSSAPQQSYGELNDIIKHTLPDWSTFRPGITITKPKISIGILTMNRKDMIQNCLESLSATMRHNLFDYRVFVTDDSSSDGTIDYLKSLDYPWLEWTTSPRGGVNYQSNRVMEHFYGDVGYGFIVNDDIVFRSPGWEEIYVSAIRGTPYDHFVFADLGFWGGRPKTPHVLMSVNGILLVNWFKNRVQGALVTYTDRVLETVGGMDGNFGMTSHEHVDWTIRNRRAGLAPGTSAWNDGAYDVMGSNNFLKINLDGYRPAAPKVKQWSESYFNSIRNNTSRIYLPIETTWSGERRA